MRWCNDCNEQKNTVFVGGKPEYGINLTAEDSVQIDTFTQLCDCIYQKLEEKQV